MKENRLNQHIHGWLEKIQENIDAYKLSGNTSDDGRLAFISHQYHLVMLIYKALNSQVIFVGAKKPIP
jgi:uncharacterized lipoprotein YbaY